MQVLAHASFTESMNYNMNAAALVNDAVVFCPGGDAGMTLTMCHELVLPHAYIHIRAWILISLP